MTDDAPPPSFEIPVRPERRYPPGGGITYEGRTIFALHTDPPLSQTELESHLLATLEKDAYTYSARDEYPAPVYLVHDRKRRTVFRVVVREDRLELHVLPNTDSQTIRAVYDRLEQLDDVRWTVECRTSGSD